MVRDEDIFVDVRSIEKKYCTLFGDDLHFSETFQRTLFRLIQGGLVLTESCHPYNYERDVENLIKDDKIAISECGRFYLFTLIQRLDYLYFMKDDINWSDDAPELICASVDTSRQTKFINTLKALEKLMRIEFHMLQRLRDTSSNNTDENTMYLYKREFSAHKIFPSIGTILFTKLMYKNIEKYIKTVDPRFFDAERSGKKNIDLILKNNHELEKAFL